MSLTISTMCSTFMPYASAAMRAMRSWIGVDDMAFGPRESDQRHAGFLGEMDRERSRRGNRGEQRDADRRRLLHHLVARAAGHDEESIVDALAALRSSRRSACRARCGGRRPRAAMRRCRPTSRPRRRVRRAGRDVERLADRAIARARAADVSAADLRARTDRRRLTHRVFERLRAAKPAAGAAGQIAMPRFERLARAIRECAGAARCLRAASASRSIRARSPRRSSLRSARNRARNPRDRAASPSSRRAADRCRPERSALLRRSHPSAARPCPRESAAIGRRTKPACASPVTDADRLRRVALRPAHALVQKFLLPFAERAIALLPFRRLRRRASPAPP